MTKRPFRGSETNSKGHPPRPIGPPEHFRTIEKRTADAGPGRAIVPDGDAAPASEREQSNEEAAGRVVRRVDRRGVAARRDVAAIGAGPLLVPPERRPRGPPRLD